MPLVELYTTGSSISTLSSVLTSDSTATVTSLSDSISVSAFSIHEARREVPKSAKATSYRIPDRTVVEAIDDADFPALLPPLSYPRHAKSMPNVNDSYTRMPNRKRRPRSTKDFRLLPAFELEAQRMEVEHRSVSDSGHARLERSSTLVKGYTFPPRPAQPDSPAFDGLSPRRPSVDDGDRSRRQKFRQCVIVDGERVSPPTSPKEAPQDITALGAILALFQPGSDSGTDAVERALLKAVKNEEQRLEAMGEMFDAEARARLAWLLEQVGQELSRPDLVCAVDRVLYTISSPTRPLGRSPSTYKVSTPRNRLSHQHRPSVSSKPLSIVVPPREHAGIELEVGSPAMHPATIRTYGLCPGSSSPPISESDEDSLEFDATPTVTDYAFHTPPLRICRNLQGQSPLLHRRSALRHRNRHSPSTSTPSPTNTPSTSPNTTPTASPSPLSTPIIYQSSRTYTTSSLSPLIHAEAALKQPPLSPPASRLVHAL
ncbi:hypothetical protein CC85DRAFT_289026 [Cutaneotrichosporon oleaginosum]|uniref:Uncharacterized protein n=1 Tax=Cutaneotrichosporon oleaginosum TaxID=879819 RepID=A0A0J0XD06_9TREE|nr:uncharacterized protein CC85DRAFT_289026 [Cutaneotrichosporon oleaginosum]KLT38946.1 hypothetical protein CC85DRAFT_289026 [Cutaneotrichosporon oleaginosum]TXT07594.1 hypothetical protein COLE_04518 [Cutaneotrichosporon oleaginosum]